MKVMMKMVVIVVMMTIMVMDMVMIKIQMKILNHQRVVQRNNKRKVAKVVQVQKDNNKNANSNELICLSS